MENNLFSETAPPSQNIIKATDDDDSEEIKISNFNEQLLSAFDSIKPKIDSLENSIKLSKIKMKEDSNDINFDLNSTLSEIQAKMPEIHNQSIKLSRKIQKLSLKSQTSSTIAAPKTIRPIFDDFHSFKDKFDQSLKQIIKITENLNEGIEKIETVVKKASEDSQLLTSLQKEVKNINIKNQENLKRINEVREKAIDELKKDFDKQFENFEQSLNEAENLVTQLETSAEKGLENSNQTVVKLENDRFDIESSFETLSKEIESTMKERIKELQSKIQRNIEKNEISFQKIDKELSIGINQVQDEIKDNLSPPVNQLDELKENEDLESLLNRINNLEKGIKRKKHHSDSGKIDGLVSKHFGNLISFANNEDKLSDENEVKRLKALINGEEKTVVLFANKTFKIEEE